ncbi:MAG: SBBP repeat-containing protein [Cytophagaceae bacterium]
MPCYLFHKLLLSNLLIACLTTFGYSQDYYEWGRGGGGRAGEMPYCVKTDSVGNTYVTGSFSDTANIGGFIINCTDANDIDMFLAKYNSLGICQWVRTLGQSGTDFGAAIDFDKQGYIYVGGKLKGDMFARYDHHGNLLRTIPAVTWAQVQSIAVYDRYILAAGVFGNTATFGSISLTANGPYDAFIVCYDTSGAFQWAKQYGGSAPEEATNIAVDKNGNSYMVGHNLGAPGQIFIVKYDITGNLVWAKESTGPDVIDSKCFAIDIDQAGNIYLGVLGIDMTLDSFTANNSVLIKIKPEGTVVWMKETSDNTVSINSLKFDYNNDLYITGQYSGDTIHFGNATLPASGFDNFYVAKYDSSGNNIMAKGGYLTPSLGGVGGTSLSFDKLNNIYVGGFYGPYGPDSYNAHFDSITLAGSGDKDIFLLKLLHEGASKPVVKASNPEIFIPNLITANADGLNDFFTIKGLQPNSSLNIYNRWGELIYYSEDYKNDWSAPVSAGLYYFNFTNSKDQKNRHGWVEVIK